MDMVIEIKMTAKVKYIPKINVAFFCAWGESR